MLQKEFLEEQTKNRTKIKKQRKSKNNLPWKSNKQQVPLIRMEERNGK